MFGWVSTRVVRRHEMQNRFLLVIEVNIERYKMLNTEYVERLVQDKKCERKIWRTISESMGQHETIRK